MNQEQKDRAIAAIRAAPRLKTGSPFTPRGNPACAVGYLAVAAEVKEPYYSVYDRVAEAYGINVTGRHSVEAIWRANDDAPLFRKRAVLAVIEAIPTTEEIA